MLTCCSGILSYNPDSIPSLAVDQIEGLHADRRGGLAANLGRGIYDSTLLMYKNIVVIYAANGAGPEHIDKVRGGSQS